MLLLQNRSGTVNIVDKCCWVPDGINVMLMWYSSSAHNRSFTFFEDTHHWCELVQIWPLQSQGSCEHGLHVSPHVLYQLILVMIQIYKGYMAQISGMQGLRFGQMGSRPCRTQREGHFHHKPRLWELFETLADLYVEEVQHGRRCIAYSMTAKVNSASRTPLLLYFCTRHQKHLPMWWWHI